jgi:fatty-acyl-CoA synthase
MAVPQHYDDLPMNWVGDWAGRRAALTPRRVAVYDSASGARYTYAQMNERANRVGTWLRDTLGLQKGDRICLLARNRTEAVDLYLAAGKCGFILAPLSYRLSKRELDDLLRRIQPQVLFYEDVFAELVDSLERPESVKESVLIADGEQARFTAELLATAPEEVNRPLALNDPFLYIHTGGTTATPKVCVVSHRQMLWNSFDLVITSGGAMGEARELLTFPLFHIGGWNTLTPIFHSGGFTVLLRQFDPGLLLELVEREHITHFGAVEAMLQFLARHPSFAQTSLESLQGITTGGAPCSAAAMRPFWERGIPVTQAYGMTEAGPSNFVHAGIDESMDEIWERNASIGTPFFHSDYQIVDPETHQPLPRGETGVLCMRSPHNFEEYLGQPERTEQIFLEGGWVYSGDLAREDADGYVYIVGRADNMFISGGENVSPEEIENVLSVHSDVAQVAVVGVPDPAWGQVALAAIVAKPGTQPSADELIAYCKQHLAAYKVPRRFEFVAELPLTGAGKIDRKRLQADLG